MARRGMSGQLNMFDLFQTLEEAALGEVEMVSLMPEYEAEPEVVEIPEVVETPEIVEESETEEEPEVEEVSEVEEEPEIAPIRFEDKKVAMSRSYVIAGKKIEIAYMNYNKVCISKEGETPVVKEFASTIEAVDYYVEKMKELEKDE